MFANDEHLIKIFWRYFTPKKWLFVFQRHHELNESKLKSIWIFNNIKCLTSNTQFLLMIGLCQMKSTRSHSQYFAQKLLSIYLYWQPISLFIQAINFPMLAEHSIYNQIEKQNTVPLHLDSPI